MQRLARLSALAVRGASLLPPRLRRSLRQNPTSWRVLQRLLPAVLSADASMVVKVRSGPLAGSRLNVGRGSGYWLGEHDDPAVLETLQRFARPGMLAIDVGANVGTETLLLASAVGPSGTVISVEPDPKNAARLRATCSLNGLHNVRLVEKVVSNRTGEIAFAASGELTSHVSASAGESSSIPVPCIKLDDLTQEISHTQVGLVKIDVEGHEVEVLEGAHELLSRARPVLVMEVHTNETLRGCVRILVDHDYLLSTIGANKYLEDILGGHVREDSLFARGHFLGVPTERQRPAGLP